MNHQNIEIFKERVGMSFDEAYIKNYPSLKNYIKKFNVTDEFADDFTSDMLLKSLEKISQYQPTHKYNSWLFTITHNSILTILGNKSSEYNNTITFSNLFNNTVNSNNMSDDMEFSIEYFIGETTKDDDSFENKFNNLQFINRIWEYMAELPDECQLVMYERFWNDKKYREIADEQNINLNTVKTIIFRSTGFLKDKLENNNEYVYE